MTRTHSSKKSEILLPNKRNELIQILTELSDSSLQTSLWIRHEDYPNSSGIDHVFHFLFDDTDLADDPYSEIARILKNRTEAKMLEDLTTALHAMLLRLGDQHSKNFMADKAWPSIIAKSRLVLKEIL